MANRGGHRQDSRNSQKSDPPNPLRNGAMTDRGNLILVEAAPYTPPEPADTVVLVVDDQPWICKALAMAFSEAGYQVITAGSGEDAIATIKAERVDVLLVELRISDIRGDEVFEYACGVQPALRDRTLFMTGDISDEAVELIEACRCNFIRKPFDLSTMLSAVWAIATQPPSVLVRACERPPTPTRPARGYRGGRSLSGPLGPRRVDDRHDDPPGVA